MAKNGSDEAVEVKKLVIRVGGKDLGFSLDEAKQLHAALEELFGEKIVVKEVHHNQPIWYWNYPAIQYVWTTSNPAKWTMTYGDKTISYGGNI